MSSITWLDILGKVQKTGRAYYNLKAAKVLLACAFTQVTIVANEAGETSSNQQFCNLNNMY